VYVDTVMFDFVTIMKLKNIIKSMINKIVCLLV